MLEEVIKEGRFVNALDKNNLASFANEEMSIWNLTAKGEKYKEYFLLNILGLLYKSGHSIHILPKHSYAFYSYTIIICMNIVL